MNQPIIFHFFYKLSAVCIISNAFGTIPSDLQVNDIASLDEYNTKTEIQLSFQHMLNIEFNMFVYY